MCPLSVVIITKDEGENLRRTLESVRFADEIVIVDSGSSDDTVVIAREYTPLVVAQDWLGFSGQKNYAISLASHDWILSLDADEVVSVPLQQQIREVVTGGSAFEAYSLRRKNFFLGTWMKHAGFYPDRKIRLFKRGTAQFEAREVHESIHCSGRVAHLDADIDHYAYPTLEIYIEHQNRYSTLGARRLSEQGRRSSIVIDVLLRPLFGFVYNYFFRLGFCDGRKGFLLNFYQAVYGSWKYAKLWHLNQER